MVLSQLLASAPDFPTGWSALGIGAFVAAPAWALAYKFYLDNKALVKDAIERERELSSTTVPALTEASRLLSTAPARFDQALSQASTATKASEQDLALRRLEDLAERLERRDRNR